jgi:hypothetical protein
MNLYAGDVDKIGCGFLDVGLSAGKGANVLIQN